MSVVLGIRMLRGVSQTVGFGAVRCTEVVRTDEMSSTTSEVGVFPTGLDSGQRAKRASSLLQTTTTTGLTMRGYNGRDAPSH